MLRIQVWFESPPVFQLTGQTTWLLVRSLTLIRTVTSSTKVLSLLLKVAQRVPKCLYETKTWMKNVDLNYSSLDKRKANFIAYVVNSSAVKS